MLNIKITIPGFKNDLNISQFTGNDNNIINGCRFYVNTSDLLEFDSWFVIENLYSDSETSLVPKNNVFFLTAETLWKENWWLKASKKKYLDQFSKIFTHYDTYHNEIKCPPFVPWMINANHGDSIFGKHERDLNYFISQNHLEKTKNLSIICSDKTFTEDHKQRFNFATKIKEHFQEDVDWFGNGVNAIEEKWEGISQYKYHIALEKLEC
jgi:hypothetical protein